MKEKNGGAIALCGNAVMVVEKNVQLTFVNNIAHNLGGAIYSIYTGNRESIDTRNCFIQYFDITQNPDHWNVSFVFENNLANNKPNAIFSTTIRPCLWGRAFGPAQESNLVKKVFCWNGWLYNGKNDSETCIDFIMTDPAKFQSYSPFNLSVQPGQETNLGIVAYDDQNENVTSLLVFSAFPTTEGIGVDNKNLSYISSNSILLSRTGSAKSAIVSLESAGPRSLATELNVSFTECPIGFQVDNSTGVCVQLGKFGGVLSYGTGPYQIYLLRGYWIGFVQTNDNNDSVVAVAECRYCNYTNSGGYIVLQGTADEVKQQLCGGTRNGILCATCNNGYAPSFNAERFDCVQCNEGKAKYSWLLFVLLKVVAPLGMFFLLYITQFSLTSGLLNGAIFLLSDDHLCN